MTGGRNYFRQRIAAAAILPLLLLLLLTGCSQQDGRHPLYVRAQRKIQAPNMPRRKNCCWPI
ncbi:MAG: hypothetical protein PHQ27_09555 [Victivallales bacterium]|nr:hypothetical protein [Victivallales bacterium]